MNDRGHNSDIGNSSSLFDEDDASLVILNSKPVGTRGMANERTSPKAGPVPGKAAPKPLYDLTLSSPEFGKTSPLRNPLKGVAPSIFNIPKQNKPRREHHRPPPSQNGAPQFRHPPGSHPEVVEIPKPAKIPTFTTYPAGPATFSSLAPPHGFQPINGFSNARPLVNNTTEYEGFNPDKALTDIKFGETDPFTYVDAAKANENIKALLEGAFDDDEEDIVRPRRRRKARDSAAASLVGKLQNLDMKAQSATPEDHEDDDGEDDAVVEGLAVRLLPHQIEGLAWMMDREVGKKKKNGVLPKGGILADDMGLGKTIQALALILNNPRPADDAKTEDIKRKIPKAVGKGTLVVAPLALIRQWEDEIKTKVQDSHKLNVLVHHGSSRTKSFKELKKYDVVITTYQTLTSEHAATTPGEDGITIGCFGVHWYRIILDEAHSIKNRNAKSTQACYALDSHYRWCLTGTPMQNNLDELQSLIKFLRIKPYDELKPWKEHITGPMKNGRGGIAMRRLQYFLKALMKRRTKDILKQEGALDITSKSAAGDAKPKGFKIVERKVENLVAEFNAREQRFYDRLAARAEMSLQEMIEAEQANYMGALVLLLRLRQACNHPELVKKSLNKDKDALTTGTNGASGSQVKQNGANELDDLAGMLGGLSVDTKQCDVCRARLSQWDVKTGAIRCGDCEADLASQEESAMLETEEDGHEALTKNKAGKGKKAVSSRQHRVIDSDDESEGEGDWVVPRDAREIPHLGKAGGTDDENAEGGGQWLNSEDSDSDDEAKAERDTEKRRSIETTSSDDDEPADSSVDDGFDLKENKALDNQTHKSSNQAKQSRLVTSTKIRHLTKILKRESKEHKFIVFSQFTTMLDLIEPFLLKENIVFCRYDGSMRNDVREASLQRLRTERKTRVMLCSLKCGSLGLNLTAASRVVIMEPFWNPFVEEQAIDRVHRLNQTVDVVVYKLTIANTVEERILDLQESKRKLANAAIEGGRAMGKLSMKDIMQLFRREAEHDHHAQGDDHSLGSKTHVLKALPKASSPSPGPDDIRRDMHAKKSFAARQEDPVYGRR